MNLGWAGDVVARRESTDGAVDDVAVCIRAADSGVADKRLAALKIIGDGALLGTEMIR